jgi:predicted NAD/FAD-dependent oxidoreductase
LATAIPILAFYQHALSDREPDDSNGDVSVPHAIKIAIIGAGISGLRLAQALQSVARVQVFEKSGGFGGRMSTRRATPYAFDHGAQCFTAQTPEFQEFLATMPAAGAVALWDPVVTRFGRASGHQGRDGTRLLHVATPVMNGLCKSMAQSIDVELKTEISTLAPAGPKWDLLTIGDKRYAGFDWVLSTAPAAQTRRLMPDDFAGQAELCDVRMSPCFSLMLGWPERAAPDWDVAEVSDAPLAWMAVNSRKPGRDGALSILCQSTSDWAKRNLEADRDAVRDRLLAAFAELTGIEDRPEHIALHRWRYATVERSATEPCLFDPVLGLGAAGDWCGAGDVEAAFISATALARRVRQFLV